jgi:hypothetical protein
MPSQLLKTAMARQGFTGDLLSQGGSSSGTMHGQLDECGPAKEFDL